MKFSNRDSLQQRNDPVAVQKDVGLEGQYGRPGQTGGRQIIRESTSALAKDLKGRDGRSMGEGEDRCDVNTNIERLVGAMRTSGRSMTRAGHFPRIFCDEGN
jgi:hypothetical protein